MRTNKTAVITALALAIVGSVVLAVFREASIEGVYPVERAKCLFTRHIWARVKGAFNGVVYARENAQLKREIAALSMTLGDNERLEAENAHLREVLAYAQREPGKWIAAPILSEGGASAGARKTIRVGKGSLAGVAKDQIVRVPEGLVGRVESVTPHTAQILLITDPSLKVSCVIEGAASRVLGILSGGTEEMLVLSHMTAGASIPPRARVLTSGLGGVFPAGITVGTFLSDKYSSDEVMPSMRTGEVQPAVDFAALEDVFIRHEN